MRRLFVLVAIPVALSGCGSSGGYSAKPAKKIADVAVKPGDEANLMPFKVGNQWVYTIETSQGTSDITLKVTDVQNVDGATVATLSTQIGGASASETRWRQDSTGLYQVSNGSQVFDPPQLLIPFPLTEGKEIKVKTTGPLPAGTGTGEMEITLKYIGTQHVDTVGDRMGAVAVESLTTWNTPDGPAASRGMTWWVPNVGFVRQRQDIGVGQSRGAVLMKLKSHSFK
jgi:hypothetical protein